MSYWETTDKFAARFYVDDDDDAVIAPYYWQYKASTGYIFRWRLKSDPRHYPYAVYLHSWFFNFPPVRYKLRFRDGNKLNLSKSNLFFDTMRRDHPDWLRAPVPLTALEAKYAVERPVRPVQPRKVRVRKDGQEKERLAKMAADLRAKLRSAQ